jgi:flagellar biosynthesis chaperone FliJ
VKKKKKKGKQVGELRRQKPTPMLLIQTIKEIKEKDSIKISKFMASKDA